MFKLALRLAFGGGREAIVRFAVIAGGVMIGVALLLFSISALNVLNGSSKKACWECTGRLQLSPSEAEDAANNATRYPILWLHTDDYYHGQTIHRYDLALRARTGSGIPGIPRLPAPGEYYASPALARLIAGAPADQLGNRFPGKLIGQIGSSGLNAPDALVAVVGREVPELMGQSSINGSTIPVTRIQDQPASRSLGPFITALFVIAVSGLLFAILTLIATSTRLAAARREERFAALRLLGATPRQISYFAGVDAALSALLGALMGLALFFVVRSALANSLSSELVAFFPEDLTPGLAGILAVLLGAPCLAAFAAVMSLRKVRISPLGVMRRARPRAPRDWRIIPLLVGLATLAGVWLRNRHIVNSDVRADALPYFVIGFILVIAGLAIAGPWLTMVVSKLLARYARGATVLLASRRLADNPTAAFRPVSVMVTTILLCTIIAGTAPILLDGLQVGDQNASNILSDSQIFIGSNSGGLRLGLTAAEANQRRALLESVPGVHTTPILFDTSRSENITSLIVSCDGLRLLKEFGSCTRDATAMRMDAVFYWNYLANRNFATKPAALHTSAAELAALPTYGFIVLTDGQPAHLEQLRTLLVQHSESLTAGARTWKEENAERIKQFNGVRLLINSGLVLVLLVAGCSLAVASAGGLIERKRPLGLLRLAGMSLGQLARIVLYESVAPLLSAAAVALALGFGTAVLLAKSFASKDMPAVQALPVDYYIVLGFGICVALAVSLATLPLLAAVTKPENARFE